jgi:hypothetical protein
MFPFFVRASKTAPALIIEYGKKEEARQEKVMVLVKEKGLRGFRLILIKFKLNF